MICTPEEKPDLVLWCSLNKFWAISPIFQPKFENFFYKISTTKSGLSIDEKTRGTTFCPSKAKT